MKKKTRYWLLKLVITIGDYEFFDKSLHKCKGEFDGENYAKNFYGDADEPDVDFDADGVYYFNGAELAVSVFGMKELTKKEYEVMNKYL